MIDQQLAPHENQAGAILDGVGGSSATQLNQLQVQTTRSVVVSLQRQRQQYHNNQQLTGHFYCFAGILSLQFLLFVIMSLQFYP